jgi:hypothetical protein
VQVPPNCTGAHVAALVCDLQRKMPETAEKALTEEEREDLLEAFKNFDKVR